MSINLERYKQKLSVLKKAKDNLESKKDSKSYERGRAIILQTLPMFFEGTDILVKPNLLKQTDSTNKLSFNFHWTNSRKKFFQNKAFFKGLFASIFEVVYDIPIVIDHFKISGKKKIKIMIDENETQKIQRAYFEKKEKIETEKNKAVEDV